MSCQRCNSIRILGVTAKASDLFAESIGDKYRTGYLSHDLGLGGGDYLDLNFCLDCGQIQGSFPRPTTEIETMEMPKWVIQHVNHDDWFWDEPVNAWSDFSRCTRYTDKDECDRPYMGKFVLISDL